mmetsp:Transcript_23426/g.51900  ORF Transcript_23426/g.51900 Transcript_23426/m.51900 type:complete len:372 (-) Transcript_23426:619-1734(-)
MRIKVHVYCYAFAAVICLSSSSASAKRQPGYHFHVARKKGSDGEDLCVTAKDGGKDYSSIRLRPCEFEKEPPNQLWRHDIDGKIHSAIGEGDQCIVVGKPSADEYHFVDLYGRGGRNYFNVAEGTKMYTANCNIERDLKYFEYLYSEGEKNNCLKADSMQESIDSAVSHMGADCMSFEGKKPKSGSAVVLKKCDCMEDPMFSWDRTPWEYIYLVSRFNEHLGTGWEECITAPLRWDQRTPPRYTPVMPAKNARVPITECLFERYWDELWRIDDEGMIHSALDDDLCLKASKIRKGKQLKIAPCKATDKRQHWTYEPDGHLSPAGYESQLCVAKPGFTGRESEHPHTSSENKPVLKNCKDKPRFMWADEQFD